MKETIKLLEERGVFSKMKEIDKEFDKNIILYGPPGTGKTYNSAIYAVAICDGKSVDELTDYDAVMKRYIELKKTGRIAFTTFHAGYIPVSALVEKHQMKENEETRQILERFEGIDVPIFTAEFEVLTKLTGFKLTRGMLCAMKRKPLLNYQDMCAGKDRIVILENVMNPTNVGAIFRSAAALNMDAVFLTPGCSDPLYRRASRVSMGTVFQIPWTFIQDNNEMRCQREMLWPRQAITELREMGYKTAALALTDDSVGIDNPELMQEEKLAIILGTEGEGLMDRTIEMCDYTVKIPMSHDVDSLNVAAASAVAFWQLGKKQK